MMRAEEVVATLKVEEMVKVWDMTGMSKGEEVLETLNVEVEEVEVREVEV